MPHDNRVHVKSQTPHRIIDKSRKAVATEIAGQLPRNAEHEHDSPREHLLAGVIPQADKEFHAARDRGSEGGTCYSHLRQPAQTENQHRIQHNIQTEGEDGDGGGHFHTFTAFHHRKIRLCYSHKEI